MVGTSEPASATPPDAERDRTLWRFALCAMGIAVLGAVLGAVGSLLPTLLGTQRGFGSAPLLGVLAVAPAVVAGLFLARSRTGLALGVLVGAAALAPAAAVLDFQLVHDPSAASRPELYLPTDLSLPDLAIGWWALLGGHAAVLLAGVLAVFALRRANVFDGHDDPALVAGWRRRAVLGALSFAALGVCGLLMTPFHSHDLYLLAQNAFEGTTIQLVGHAVSALALLVAAVLVVVLPGEVAVARGGLIGLGLAVAGLALPSLAAAVSMRDVDIAAGSVLAVVAACGLPAAGALGGVRSGREDSAEPGSRAGEVRLPGRRKLELATAVLALVTGVFAVAGAVLPQIDVVGTGPVPQSPARWLLLVAGVGVGLLGAAMLSPRMGAPARPIVSVAWAGVPLAASAVLDTALTTGFSPASFPSDSDLVLGHFTPESVGTGPGMLWAWLAMVAAVVTACCSVVAGMVEREDSEEPMPESGPLSAIGLRMLTPLTAAMVLSVAAFGLPMVTAPGYVEAGLWARLGAPTLGLAVAVLTVLGACLLALRSRPPRARALLAGAACVVALRAAAAPLVGGEIDGSAAGPGLWFCLAALAALVLAGVMGTRGISPRERESEA